VREILERVLQKHRLPRRIAPSTWAQAVGPELASRAQPTVLSGGILHVLVQDHRWRDQIDAARRMVIDRLNQRLGAPLVRELQFGLAHSGALTPRRPEPPPGPAIEPHKVLGASRLEPMLREAILCAAEAASGRAARA